MFFKLLFLEMVVVFLSLKSEIFQILYRRGKFNKYLFLGILEYIVDRVYCNNNLKFKLFRKSTNESFIRIIHKTCKNIHKKY